MESASVVPARQPDRVDDRVALADAGGGRTGPRRHVGTFIAVPDDVLGGILGFFAGFFLYVGAAELLPEAHRRDRRRLVAVATLAGALGVYLFSVAVGAIGVDAPLTAGGQPASAASSSAAVGIPSRAPARVTASEAATTARRAASSGQAAASPAASAPLSVSPAPTVSTARPGAGMPSAVRRRARAPRRRG